MKSISLNAWSYVSQKTGPLVSFFQLSQAYVHKSHIYKSFYSANEQLCEQFETAKQYSKSAIDSVSQLKWHQNSNPFTLKLNGNINCFNNSNYYLFHKNYLGINKICRSSSAT